MIAPVTHSPGRDVMEWTERFAGERRMIHAPVMVREVLGYLLYSDSRLILDGTVGGGGHARAVLGAKPDVAVLGLDVDASALAVAGEVLARYGRRVRLERRSYADMAWLAKSGPFDGVLLDLGLSSMQIDEPSRGFSHQADAPLGMSMSGRGRSAAELLATITYDDLKKILKEYGDIPEAARVARWIIAGRDARDMHTTADLRSAVEAALGNRATPSLQSRVFQSIRIALNREIDNIATFLDGIVEHLRPNARLVFISYHSGEDRLVKDFLKRESTDCLCPPGLPVCACGHKASLEVLTKRVVKPSPGELTRNSRARSARLRAARFIGKEIE